MDGIQEMVNLESLSMYAGKLRAFPGEFYPVFDVCHIVLCCLAVRKETGRDFAWDRPIVTWASCMISSFAGSLLVNPLLGKPILDAFGNEYLLLVATLIYLVVYFSPLDVGYKLIKLLPIYIVVCTIKEVYRPLKIAKGLKEGAEFKPDSMFVPILIGILKGNGSGFMTPFTRVVRGVWTPDENEIIKASVTSKLCFLVGLAFVMIDAKFSDLVYLSAVGIFVLVKLTTVLNGPVDPVKPFEDLLFRILGHGAKEVKQEAKKKKKE